jgi:hypothetical protein
MTNKKLSLFTFVILFSSYLFVGGDCGTDSNPDPAPGTLAPPAGMSLVINAIAGGGSYALINWSASPDENRSDFKGYRIITAELNASGQITSVFQEQALPKTQKSFQVLSIMRGTRYKTFLLSELEDGTRSDSLETEIYSGVFYNNDGVIDSYTAGPGNARSGYGWDVFTGAGAQYAYTGANAGVIDIHLRLLENELFFFSPNTFETLFKLTSYGLVGSGSSAFDDTNLEEPNRSLIKVEQDNVYLLKTQEDHYIKIWVKAIDPPTATENYYTVEFDYKLQPVEGLRIVKR